MFSEIRNVTFASSIFVEWERGAKANLVEAVPAIRLHLSVVNSINVRNRALNLIHAKSQVELLNAALNSTFAWSTTWQLPPSPDRSYDFRSTSTFTLFNKYSTCINPIMTQRFWNTFLRRNIRDPARIPIHDANCVARISLANASYLQMNAGASNAIRCGMRSRRTDGLDWEGWDFWWKIAHVACDTVLKSWDRQLSNAL